nr:hypothetical protein Iba_scaffold12962CG0010 [Ipomoea batatas]
MVGGRTAIWLHLAVPNHFFMDLLDQPSPISGRRLLEVCTWETPFTSCQFRMGINPECLILHIGTQLMPLNMHTLRFMAYRAQIHCQLVTCLPSLAVPGIQ